MIFNTERELERMRETRVSSQLIYDGAIMRVQKDIIRLPDGSEGFREYLRHIGAVCVIPVTENNEVVVERQYRYPVDRVILEIPAGKLDSPEENRLSAIQRELREETGFTAEEWTDLGPLFAAPAYSDEYISMYMARGLRRGEQHLDEGEVLDVALVPLADLVRDVMEGRIPDSKTQICILKAARLLGI